MFKTRQTAQPVITIILISSLEAENWTSVAWLGSSLPADAVRTAGGDRGRSKSVSENWFTAQLFSPPHLLGNNLRHWYPELYEIRSPFQSYSAEAVEFVIYGINFYINRGSDQSLAGVVW